VPSVRATADSTAVRLSDTLTVVVTADGPAPLRVDPPKDLLAPESALVWKVELLGPATLTDRGTDQRWQQAYKLSPFVPGEAVPVAFNPLKVNGADLTPDPLTVKVETSLQTAKADDARPVTGIELLPAVPSAGFGWGLGLTAGVVVLFLVAVLAALLRHRAKPKPVPPTEWALAELDDLDPDRLTSRELTDGLTTVVRGFVGRRFALAPDPFTTAELLAAGDAADIWSADTRTRVSAVLEACDRVKFAGQPATADDCRRWRDELRTAIMGWATPAE
jgi:hypothetical protein